MGSNTEQKPGTNLQNSYKSDNFCYRKVGRAITKWGAKEKSPISIAILEIITIFKGQKNYFAF